jgi:hypothetical protein
MNALMLESGGQVSGQGLGRASGSGILCMEVSRQAGIPTAQTQVSDDGQALVVHRFDFENDGVTRKGMKDLCNLLSLRPEEKYQSTWERVVPHDGCGDHSSPAERGALAVG